MLTIGVFAVVACFMSECPARMSVTLLKKDYSYVKPNEALITYVQRVLDNMAVEQIHPRMRHLYNLLQKDIDYDVIEPGQIHHASEILDFQRTLKPKYDVNKLNRMYTTEADG